MLGLMISGCLCSIEAQTLPEQYEYVKQWGGMGSGPGQFGLDHGPMESTFADNGYLYIADYGNNRIQKFTGSGDPSTWGVYVDEWHTGYVYGLEFYRPDGYLYYSVVYGQLGKSTTEGTIEWNVPVTSGAWQTHGIAVDCEGNIRVCENYLGKIYKYDRNGNYLDTWDWPGGEVEPNAEEIAADFDGDLWIREGSKIIEHTCQDQPTGRVIDTSPNNIRALTIDECGNIYISLFPSRQIRKYNSDLELLAEWGEEGEGPGQFAISRGIAVKGCGDGVVVSDSMDGPLGDGNYRVQVFRKAEPISLVNEYWFPLIDDFKWWSRASDLGSDIIVHAYEDDTTVVLDYDYDRTWDTGEPGLTLAAGDYHYFTRPPDGAAILVVTSKPVDIYHRHFNNNYGTYDDTSVFYEPAIPGHRIVVPLEMKTRIAGTRDNTTVTIDDGLSTETVLLGQGQTYEKSGRLPAGTIITADLPVTAVGYDYNAASEDTTYAIGLTPVEQSGRTFWAFGQLPTRWYSIGSDDRRIVFAHDDGTITEEMVPVEPTRYDMAGKAVAYFIYDITAKSHSGDSYRRRMGAYALSAKNHTGLEYVRTGNLLSLEDGNLIEIDNDYDGVPDESFYLNEGETYNLSGPVPGDNRTQTHYKGHVRSSHGVLNIDYTVYGGPSYEDAPSHRSLPPIRRVIRETEPVAVITVADTIECTSFDATEALLDGSSSWDPDSTPDTNDDIVSFEWYSGFGTIQEQFLGASEIMIADLSYGNHEITLIVWDSAGLTDSALKEVSIIDTLPPTIVGCPDDLEISCNLPPLPAEVTATDMCNSGSTSVDFVESREDSPDKYVISRAWSATDHAGNASSCPQDVTVFRPALHILDNEAISSGTSSIEGLAEQSPSGCGFGDSSVCVNEDIKGDWTLREPLFNSQPVKPGTLLTLPSGEKGDEGWFAPMDGFNAPITTLDFINGTIDNESDLDKTRDVWPLGDAELMALEGECICGVVYDSDVSIDYKDVPVGNLQGTTLGLTAFVVKETSEPGSLPESQSSSSLRDVTIELVDTDLVSSVCNDVVPQGN